MPCVRPRAGDVAGRKTFKPVTTANTMKGDVESDGEHRDRRRRKPAWGARRDRAGLEKPQGRLGWGWGGDFRSALQR